MDNGLTKPSCPISKCRELLYIDPITGYIRCVGTTCTYELRPRAEGYDFMYDAIKAAEARIARAIKGNPEDRMFKWFDYEHLKGQARQTSERFNAMANYICDNIEPGPERTVALRKLLEAKDAAVRAVIKPGG